MKRQLGPILVVLVLFFASAAWAQSGSTDSSQSGSTDSSQSSSSQDGSTDSSQSGSTQSGSTDNSQGTSNSSTSSTGTSNTGTSNKLQPGFTTPYSAEDAQQNASDSSQSNGPQPVFTHPEQLPALSSMSEVTSNTGLHFGLNAGLSADSNVTGGPGTNWAGLGSVGGVLGINQSRPKLNWNFAYGAGTAQEIGGISGYSSVTQTGQAGFLWQIAQRWQFSMSDSYYYSDDPFAPYLTIFYDPTFNNPNPTIYIPQATSQGNTGTAQLTYILGAHDSINFTGFQSFLRYQQSAYQELQNSFMWAGGAFYQHVFSPKITAGGGYEFSALDFGHGFSRAGVTTFEGFMSYKLNESMTISGWVGPELTNTKSIVPVFCFVGGGCYYEAMHQSEWDVAEGATFTWQVPHNALRVKYSHRVTNGGGLLGIVTLYLAEIGYQRILSPRWNLFAGAFYGNNNSLSNYQADQYLNSLTAQIGVTRMINQAWGVNFNYAVIEERQHNVPGYTTPRWTDNRISVNVSYSWNHSLGR